MMRQQFSGNRLCVVTNCVSRKRGGGAPICIESAQQYRSLTELSRAWLEATAQVHDTVEARDLYLGRAFRDSRQVSDRLRCELWIVSAGFGLVPGCTPLPNYNLTVAEGDGSIRPALDRLRATASDWWEALHQGSDTPLPFTNLISSATVDTVLLALPSTYIKMIERDLSNLTAADARRLRVFTSKAGAAALPRQLVDSVLPYDDRLERLPGYAGTRSDFAQRAMRHFVEALAGQTLTLDDAKLLVDQALGHRTQLTRVNRAKATDAEIATLLRLHWQQQRGSSSSLLRFLRDDAQIACEQKRFQNIWRGLKAQQARLDLP